MRTKQQRGAYKTKIFLTDLSHLIDYNWIKAFRYEHRRGPRPAGELGGVFVPYSGGRIYRGKEDGAAAVGVPQQNSW